MVISGSAFAGMTTFGSVYKKISGGGMNLSPPLSGPVHPVKIFLELLFEVVDSPPPLLGEC